MARIIQCLFALLLSLPAAAQVVRIQLGENRTYCAGFEPRNVALLKIAAVPNIRIPDNAATVFTWYAVHREGFRSWHTPVDSRAVPLPWPGSYELYVILKYIDKATLRPFFAFKSASLFLNVQDCPP